MKAAVFREKRLVVETVPDPRPAADEIVIRVSYCAICGSDLHRYAYAMMSPGTIMGHEYAGVVVEVGTNVRTWKVGDRVTRSGGPATPGRELPSLPPRYSAKERGFLPQRPGAYAEYLAVPADRVMAVPSDLSELEASLVEPLTVALHMVRASRLRLGDTAVVLGAGPIGLFALQCAFLAGASRVWVSEVNAARRGAAAALGATETFDPARTPLVQEIVRRTEVGADVAFECAGAKPTLQQALELVRWGGQVMVVSLAWEPVDCLPVEWVGREVELKACYAHLNSEWGMALALMAQGRIRTEPMISRVIGLDGIDATFRELLRPETDLVQVAVKCG
jgi:threonine dehydrogenase-like Zn-dependent dehydrogenase